MNQTLQLRNRFADLDRIESALQALVSEGKLTADQAGEVRLAVEEAFTNIVKYAYRDGRDDHPVELQLNFEHDWLTLSLSDTGEPFDPFAERHDQLDKPFEERDDGLMGIPLIRALTDECRYERTEGHNRMYLRKRITP